MKWNGLRTALRANATFSAVSGLTALLWAIPLAGWMGGFSPWILLALGPGLLLFALLLIVETRRARPVPSAALAISIADLAWVVGSAVLLMVAGPALSAGGAWTVIVVALVVLFLATWQLAGLRALTRNTRGRTAARSAFDIRLEVAARPDAIWNVIRQLDRIGEFYLALKSVEVTGTGRSEDVPTRRTCVSHKGERWSEEVAVLDDERRELSLRFDSEAPDFPFPIHPMYGGWTVRRVSGKTRVTIWYEFTMKWGLLGELMAPLLAEKIRPLMVDTIRNMDRAAAA